MNDEQEARLLGTLGALCENFESQWDVLAAQVEGMPRSPESKFVRAHIRTAMHHLREARLSVAEAITLVGLRPLESIEHDHERYEDVQLGADRYQRREER